MTLLNLCLKKPGTRRPTNWRRTSVNLPQTWSTQMGSLQCSRIISRLSICHRSRRLSWTAHKRLNRQECRKCSHITFRWLPLLIIVKEQTKARQRMQDMCKGMTKHRTARSHDSCRPGPKKSSLNRLCSRSPSKTNNNLSARPGIRSFSLKARCLNRSTR